jgi:hypothetical protein
MIETDEWVQAAEAARLLRVSRQRISMMAIEGIIETISPWDKLTLVSRRSVAERLAGAKPDPIRPRDARIWLFKRYEVTSMQDMLLPDVQDDMLAFIRWARPHWDQLRQERWALDTAPKLYRIGAR